jgi:polyhydroxyalkanoate synthesis repressor PhaR
MLDKPETEPAKKEAVVIKKYANRRLYNTETSSYVTLEDLAQMVRLDREFVVCDAKTGDDLTHQVLTQIIVEQESRSGGQTLLPVPFLRQLIRFYDDSMARLVPGYLQMSLETLSREQERFRSQFTNAWGPSAFEAYQEQARRNLQLFEQAMKMWTPFSAMTPGGQPGAPMEAGVAAPETPAPVAEPPRDKTMTTDIEEMKSQLAAMQAKIERLSSGERS